MKQIVIDLEPCQYFYLGSSEKYQHQAAFEYSALIVDYTRMSPSSLD